MDHNPVSSHQLGHFFHVDGKQLGQQYKDHFSDYHDWDQREHAQEWMLFAENVGERLSIDETALSQGELYTIVTNKAAAGRKGALVAMIKGTRAEDISAVLEKIPWQLRKKVKEVTLDMAATMIKAVRRSFPNASRVIDRFHVQKLAFDAVQELRIKYRWEAINEENEAITNAKRKNETYEPEILANGDTLKQLLARSRYLLFKHQSKWTLSQFERANLLFERYPKLDQAYKLSVQLGNIFTYSRAKEDAFKKLGIWYQQVEKSGIDAFNTVCKSVQAHYLHILNYFNNRSTNASAESFNAKIKAFRASSRGVRDITFFLYRLKNIYA
ncbi:transposase IS204/IS1001/IS1096/IS1165 family protein [Leadbetterella byssophila DSM 17132]|uniref:Transposase IS204/IS1001/IS1096/IS1165 family protein n=2 Tax=Leadbetterella TaxID=319458 RepID=E4RS72_LEAB4|nr:transposase IS204/IS1001/IS1096/IS1165 family protein [Leadbetterella byssophila DSM 17132]